MILSYYQISLSHISLQWIVFPTNLFIFWDLKISAYRRGNVTRFIQIRFYTIAGDINAGYRKANYKRGENCREISMFSTINNRKLVNRQSVLSVAWIWTITYPLSSRWHIIYDMTLLWRYLTHEWFYRFEIYRIKLWYLTFFYVKNWHWLARFSQTIVVLDWRHIWDLPITQKGNFRLPE